MPFRWLSYFISMVFVLFRDAIADMRYAPWWELCKIAIYEAVVVNTWCKPRQFPIFIHLFCISFSFVCSIRSMQWMHSARNNFSIPIKIYLHYYVCNAFKMKWNEMMCTAQYKIVVSIYYYYYGLTSSFIVYSSILEYELAQLNANDIVSKIRFP